MTRKEIVIRAYENGEIAQYTFGQLACHNFDDEIIRRAVEKNWISEMFAQELFDAK